MVVWEYLRGVVIADGVHMVVGESGIKIEKKRRGGEGERDVEGRFCCLSRTWRGVAVAVSAFVES